MKIRKRGLVLAFCMGLCLLLCACSQAPVYHPPKDSELVRCEVQIDGNAITNLSMVTTHGGKSYYYLMVNGVAFTVDHPMNDMSSDELTFGHFDTLLKKLLPGLKENGFGMNNTQAGNYMLTYNRATNGKNEWIAGRGVMPPGTALRYAGYYVYSIEGKNFTPGDGTAMGNDAYGFLQIWNYSAADAATKPEKQIEYIYILIGE